MPLRDKRVIIVGGGPVGSLSAVFLSKRGFKVDLYESRFDIRKEENASGRSINLALSFRGLSALKHAGIEERIRAIGIPMHSRYIHMTDGGSYTIPYGKKGQFLLSTDRLALNRELLSVAENCENVNIHFQHKLTTCDPKTASATFVRSDKSTLTETGDVIMGCDGAYSTVRRQMLRDRMDYSQTYIPHGYKELCIPPTSEGNYAMPPYHLHIWPKHEFMLIALPNLDKSFTLTLFMPFEIFDNLKTGDDVLDFFENNFPDSVPLIGKSYLKESFFALPPLPMVSVKCSPFHYGETAVLLGDAAHAMIPFHGQGLNAGLEDALILDGLMENLNCDFATVLPEFSKVRVDAGHAIADLSNINYLEMRSHVATPWFLFRKKVDYLLNTLFPFLFVPRYSMVTFTRMRYDKVLEKTKRQDKIINTSLFTLGGVIALSTAWAGWKLHRGELQIPTNSLSELMTSISSALK